ncbi:MAG: ABC transporter ATP-binding protein, partial [Actinobacteria bacterium]|nr:ABC transporter ATP-binding protein [Actinomycetota bacterium]
DVHLTYEIYTDAQKPTLRRFVTRGFQGRPAREVHAVRGVSFEARRGEAIGLIGRNGSGKSTLLRVIAGLLPATSGAVYASTDPVLLGVGAALHRELSGRRNVFMGGTALGIPREVLEARFDDIVSFAGLEDFVDMPLRAYSSGMQARLQFAIATVVTPEILMIDEALAVGDQEFKRRSEGRIKRMVSEAGTVFLVSHSMSSVRDVCSRAIWLDKGTIVHDGPVDEVVDRYLDATDGAPPA